MSTRSNPSADSRAESEIKGIALRNFPDVLAALHGEPARAQLLAALPADLRATLEHGGISASGWYPLSHYAEMHRAARRVVPEARSLARAIGRESTRRDLNGVYRVFLRVLSPSFVLSLCTRFFGTYYRPGVMKLVESRPGFGRVVLTGCVGFDENVWNDVIGGCEITMELAGASSLRVRLERGGRDGDSEATFVAWWSGAEPGAGDGSP